MPILLSMNDTTILFVHSLTDATKHRNPSAVQVTVKTERSPDVWTLAAYYCVQHEISELITRLVAAHAHKELELPLIFEGRNYTLTASRKLWKYGKTLSLSWGSTKVLPSEWKWTFVFEPRYDVEKTLT